MIYLLVTYHYNQYLSGAIVFENQVVSTITRPATTLIEVALSSTIEEVKIWAKKRSLDKQLNPEKLAATLSEYIHRVENRVSLISSICFPQNKIDINDGYEPVFIKHSKKEKKFSADDVLTKINDSLLIVDNAGMGKSTFSKYLALKSLMLGKYIPILFELRRFNHNENLLENLAKELDPLGAVFPRELFYELLNEGKFLIILDGFDEVVVEQQENLSNQIKSLSEKGINNKFILTSRRQEGLPDIVNCSRYVFSHFSLEQAKGLVKRLDEYSKAGFGDRLINEFSLVPPKFLENPLLISLLYTSFGANNSIADRISTFYREMFDALYKGHDLKNKNGYMRQKLSHLDMEDFKSLLRSLCFLMITKRKLSFLSSDDFIEFIRQSSKLSNIFPRNCDSFLNDLINAVPLVINDGCEYKFIHATIVEYFAAEFIVYHHSSKSLLDKIFSGKLFHSFYKVFEFIFDIDSNLYNHVITKTYALELKKHDFDSSDMNNVVLSSILSVRNLSLIFLPLDKYKETDRPYNSKFYPDSEIIYDNFTDFNNVSIYSWVDFEYKGDSYFMMLLADESYFRFHPIAIELLSERIPHYELKIRDETYNDYGQLIEVFGIEKWNSIRKLDILKIKEHAPVVNLAIDMLVSRRGKKQVFSKDKINNILLNIRQMSDLDEELKSFIN